MRWSFSSLIARFLIQFTAEGWRNERSHAVYEGDLTLCLHLHTTSTFQPSLNHLRSKTRKSERFKNLVHSRPPGWRWMDSMILPSSTAINSGQTEKNCSPLLRRILRSSQWMVDDDSWWQCIRVSSKTNVRVWTLINCRPRFHGASDVLSVVSHVMLCRKTLLCTTSGARYGLLTTWGSLYRELCFVKGCIAASRFVTFVSFIKGNPNTTKC